MSTYYDLQKHEFGAWIASFRAVCTANAATLGLDPAELAQIEAVADGFSDAMADLETARAAAIGATARSNQQWEQALAVVGGFNAQFQANPVVPPNLLGELGLTVPSKGGGTVPMFVPARLSAIGSSNGVNSLRWSRNGNGPRTVYVIEAAYDGTSDWQFVDNSTRTRYAHQDQTPGRFVRYRVYAQRGRRKSEPSGTVSIYSPTTGVLDVAA